MKKNNLILPDFIVITRSQKGMLWLIAILLGITSIRAQDIILFKDGSEVEAKVIEISNLEVKFRKFENPGGPIIIKKKSTVFYIKFENGTKEVFEESNSPNETRNNTMDAKNVEPMNDFDPDKSDFVDKKRKNFNGPRVGITHIGPGTTSDYLAQDGKNPYLTQFGWQFEGRLWTTSDGTTGLIEFVPLIGGVEQGLFIPSASFLLGLRSGKNSSLEFAIGPNFSLKADHNGVVKGAMGVVFAVGTSFRKDNVWFPISLVFVPSVGKSEQTYDQKGQPILNADGSPVKATYQSGFRLALLVGFNSRSK